MNPLLELFISCFLSLLIGLFEKNKSSVLAYTVEFTNHFNIYHLFASSALIFEFTINNFL